MGNLVTVLKNKVDSALTNQYLLKVNNGNPRKICEICSKLTMMTPRQHQ